MRLLTLAIAVLVLAGVGYVSFSTPSRAAVFNDDARSAAVAHSR